MTTMNNTEFYNKVNELAEAIEMHLSDATKVYFKYEKSLDNYQTKRMNLMGADNFCGNADFYTLLTAIHFNEKENAKQAFKLTSDCITECFNNVDAYKPYGGICAWKGLDADLWLYLSQAMIILNEQLKPLMEQYFHKG